VRTLFLIAGDSIRALLHRRLLLGLIVVSLALTIVFSSYFSTRKADMNEAFMEQAAAESTDGKSQMSEADRRKFRESMEEASFFFQTAFYFVASFGGSLVALFIFSTAVTAEIRSGTIRLTLAKPVSRTQFLLGKYLGGVAVMAGYAVLASGAMLAFVHSQQMELSPGMTYAPWLMFCKQLVLGSVALLLAMFVHPVVAAGIAFFAGNGFYSQRNPLYYVLPSYGDFDLYGEMLSGTLMSASDVGWLTLYAADFVAIMLLLALWRFRTKELV
jgi:ABC-type transport system involved in multi-copper enzyme maturation permease subunit